MKEKTLFDMDWKHKRQAAAVLSELHDHLIKASGRALSEYGKLNADGEAFILRSQQEQRQDAAILQDFIKQLMRSAA